MHLAAHQQVGHAAAAVGGGSAVGDGDAAHHKGLGSGVGGGDGTEQMPLAAVIALVAAFQRHLGGHQHAVAHTAVDLHLDAQRQAAAAVREAGGAGVHQHAVHREAGGRGEGRDLAAHMAAQAVGMLAARAPDAQRAGDPEARALGGGQFDPQGHTVCQGAGHGAAVQRGIADGGGADAEGLGGGVEPGHRAPQLVAGGAAGSLHPGGRDVAGGRIGQAMDLDHRARGQRRQPGRQGVGEHRAGGHVHHLAQQRQGVGCAVKAGHRAQHQAAVTHCRGMRGGRTGIHAGVVYLDPHAQGQRLRGAQRAGIVADAGAAFVEAHAVDHDRAEAGDRALGERGGGGTAGAGCSAVGTATATAGGDHGNGGQGGQQGGLADSRTGVRAEHRQLQWDEGFCHDMCILHI